MKNTPSQTDEEVEAEEVEPEEAETGTTAETTASAADGELFEEPDELRELDEEEEDLEDEGSSGAIAGGFGIASLVLGLLSLTGTWLSSVYETRDELIISKNTTISSTAQEYPVYASMWHTQALFGMIFALAALLVGAGVLASPSLLLSGRSPGWARGLALGGVIVGVIGLVLGLLTWFGALAGQVS